MTNYGKNLLLATIAGIVFLLGAFVSSPVSEASSFAPLGDSTFLQRNQQVNLNAEGERVSFIVQPDGSMRLFSRDGQHDYLSFCNYYEGQGGDGWGVRKIEIKNPNRVLFEIKATAGAHARNVGYWIIGKYKGKWVTFVSLDTLSQYGYAVGGWHRISTDLDYAGNFVLTSQHEYMPPGAMYGYQARMATDFMAKLFWDNNAQWFGIQRIR
ncbi:hypothetical protein ACTQV0_02725 [Selenomonas montiformis]|uniref:hypothetical protein n=1 Tax=Selenomonas montiformis TaxID=2652285 RepID=UPI003F896C94